MSNATINQLPAASSIDPVQDLLPIYQNSTVATLSINRNTFLGITSSPVGLTDIQTLTNKTLTSPTLNNPVLGGTVTGTYTLGGTPTFPSTVVLTTANQTLTNKTITAPVINNPTISGGSLTSSTLVSATLSNATLTSPTVSSGMTVTGGITTDSITITGSNPTAGWIPVGQTLTYTGNNGNKEFTVTAPVDVTGTIQAGMKIQIPRSVTPPTQSMGFTYTSSQYATRATGSVTGMTFTTAFAVEAWIYVTGYTTLYQTIIGRYDGSSNGFLFRLSPAGQLALSYFSGGLETQFLSNQALPLNQWVHVAGNVSSVSGKLGSLYMNGNFIPSYLFVSNTTAMTNTGDLQIGSAKTVGQYFSGYISEARVWSAVRTAAQIQANMAISLTGSESTLIGLWQGNGNFNDKTSNANNLTATNGAIATQASNPYNSIEYGVITKAIYTGGVTTLNIFTGLSNNIPNQTLGTSSYSLQRTPYGFNGDRNNWTVNTIFRSQFQQTSAASNTWYNVGNTQIAIPAGAWRVTYSASSLGSTTTAPVAVQTTLSIASTSESDLLFSSETYINTSSPNGSQVTKTRPVTLTSQQIYYLNIKVINASLTVLYSGDISGFPILEAECTYI